MKVGQVLLLACLGVFLAAAGGCNDTGKYEVLVINLTSQIQNVEFLDKGVFKDKTLAVEPDGGKRTCKLELMGDSPRPYTVKANTASTEFVLGDKKTPNPMKFVIFPDKIVGPVPMDAEVKGSWDIKKTEKVGEGFKVTGDNP